MNVSRTHKNCDFGDDCWAIGFTTLLWGVVFSINMEWSELTRNTLPRMIPIDQHVFRMKGVGWDMSFSISLGFCQICYNLLQDIFFGDIKLPQYNVWRWYDEFMWFQVRLNGAWYMVLALAYSYWRKHPDAPYSKICTCIQAIFVHVDRYCTPDMGFPAGAIR